LVILEGVNRTIDDDRTVWLVRHGESTWNVLGLVQGHADGPRLTEKGRLQSAQVAEQFRDRHVGAIFASDLERAQETAAFIGTVVGRPISTEAALRERCFGQHEGLPLSELPSAASGISGQRVIDASARPEGGESLDQVFDRVGAFLEGLRGQSHAGDVVLVTHGGTIRALRAYSSGVSMSDTEWDTVPNGSVWRIHHAASSQPSRC
jgi:2,3-bisphosphoglycerate-dependent phosphoglycerate mutase